MKLPVYLDNNATTPLDPRVLEAMLPYYADIYGNAASRNHPYGWEAENAVENARETIASAIGAQPKEIVFTSGATESDNLAIKGVANMMHSKGNHIITCVTEHKAVLDTCHGLEQNGFVVTYLPVDRNGYIKIDELRESMNPATILVSIMHGNNEIGTLQDTHRIGAICRERGVLFHTDATQGIGKVPFDVNELNVDLASFSAHKIYGPKGCGGLYVRKSNPRVRLQPVIDGGGHERNMRSGTLNVPCIVGFGKAIQLAVSQMGDDSAKCSSFRDRMWTAFSKAIPEAVINGPDPLLEPTRRLPNNLNISFGPGSDMAILMGTKDVAVSSGSACTSASQDPSFVLRAINLDDESAKCSVRFGFGRFTTSEEVDFAIRSILDAFALTGSTLSVNEPANG